MQANHDYLDNDGEAMSTDVLAICAQASTDDINAPLVESEQCNGTHPICHEHAATNTTPSPIDKSDATKPVKHSMLPAPSQTPHASRKTKPRPVTRDRVLRVIRDIEAGKLKPPEPTNNSSNMCRAAKGSAPNVASPKKHFPAAERLRGNTQYNNRVAATGLTFGGSCKMAVDRKAIEGYRRRIVFGDAGVSMPMLSTGLMTDNGNDVPSQQEGGKIIIIPKRRRGTCCSHARRLCLGTTVRQGCSRRPRCQPCR